MKKLEEIRACTADDCQRPIRSNGLCTTHYYRIHRSGKLDLQTTADRFWAKVQAGGSCWEWQAKRTEDGYGRFWDGENHRNVRAHRWAYEQMVGPIPEGLQLDHLCRNRACVNPGHLEPVTLQENVLRGISVASINAAKTHCVNGHEFSPENTYLKSDGRGCKICRREAGRRFRMRKAA